MTTIEMWDELEAMGVEEQTLHCVTDIYGMNEDTMHNILYWWTGEQTFESEYDD